jgi:hypothetical protein
MEYIDAYAGTRGAASSSRISQPPAMAAAHACRLGCAHAGHPARPRLSRGAAHQPLVATIAHRSRSAPNPSRHADARDRASHPDRHGRRSDGPYPCDHAIQSLPGEHRPPPCTAQQLEAAFVGGSAATGNALGIFALRNTGDQPCTLHGYVQLILLDAQGQPIPMPAQQTTQALFGQTVPPPSPVVLPPGTPPLTPPRSAATAGHAFVRVIWTDVCGDGVNPAAIAIVPPGDSQPIPVAIDPTWRTAFAICAHIGPMPAGLRILPLEATPPGRLDLSS